MATATMSTTSGIVYVRSITGTIDVGTINASGGITVGSTSFVHWGGSRSTLRSPSDGVITLLNNAESSFDRLQFGGTTSSFPALKRQSATLEVRLADDSAYANLQGNNLYAYDTGQFGFASRGFVRAPSDGVWTLLNNLATGFTRLQFGGTTSSFPAIKRNSASLQFRLADDSAYADIAGGLITAAAGTATPAGGNTNVGINIGSAAVGHYIGTGAPTLSAAKGSIYVRTDATTTTTRLYINTDGGTTWTNFTSAA